MAIAHSVRASLLSRWRVGRPWVSNTVLFALGLGLTHFAQLFISEPNFHTALGISGIAEWSAAIYVGACVVVLTQPLNRWSFWLIAGFALVSRWQALWAEPFSSTDIYRYVWDGIVQHAHVNPYRYVPGDAALAYLRAPNREIYDHINRRDYAHTIYPPVAQTIYFLSTWISPTVRTMKSVMMGFEFVTIGALSFILPRIGRPREQVLLYAWCPLLIWEIAQAGHVDAVVMAFVVLAILFRVRGNQVWTGVFLGLAVMTKFYPLVLFPALYRRGDWKMPAALVAVVAAGYAVYSSVGMQVFGFLEGYTQEEGMTTGARYFLLQLAQSVSDSKLLSANAYLALCALVFLAITIWAWMYATKEDVSAWLQSPSNGSTPNFIRAAATLAFVLMLLFSPHYPWYVVWLVPFFALTPSLPLSIYLVGFLYLFTTRLALPGPGLFLLNEILYGGVLVSFLIQLGFKRWVSRRGAAVHKTASARER